MTGESDVSIVTYKKCMSVMPELSLSIFTAASLIS